MKTLKDIYESEGPIQCCRDCKIDDVKREVIDWIKAKYWCFCSCGEKLTYSYEGDLECPISENKRKDMNDFNEWYEKIKPLHEKRGGTWAELGALDFIMDFFNIKKEDL